MKLLKWIGASSLLLASCIGGPNKVIQSPATYLDAKRNYVAALAKALGMPDSSNYRLVVAAGPEWKVGDSIDPNNPLNLLSQACEWKTADLPESTKWTALPGITTNTTISFSAGLPKGVFTLLKNSLSAGFSFSDKPTGNFSISDLAGPIVAQDDFERSLEVPRCKSSRTQKSIMIRGVISGTEIFSSKTPISAAMNATVASTDLLKIQYDSNNDFEVSDKAAAPKFYLVALDTPGRSLTNPSGLSAPPDTFIQKSEALSLSR